jgi:hypothetical protein
MLWQIERPNLWALGETPRASFALAAEQEMAMAELGKFGLPISPFDPMSEPESERSERIAAVKALVLEVFTLTKVHLGEEEARKFFVKITHRKKGKRAAEKVNSKLLEFYDAVVAENPEKASSAPRQIAERLYKVGQTQYGASELAIIKKIGRLLTARENAECHALAQLEINRSHGTGILVEFFDLAIEDLKKRVSGHRAK